MGVDECHCNHAKDNAEEYNIPDNIIENNPYEEFSESRNSNKDNNNLNNDPLKISMNNNNKQIEETKNNINTEKNESTTLNNIQDNKLKELNDKITNIKNSVNNEMNKSKVTNQNSVDMQQLSFQIINTPANENKEKIKFLEDIKTSQEINITIDNVSPNKNDKEIQTIDEPINDRDKNISNHLVEINNNNIIQDDDPNNICLKQAKSSNKKFNSKSHEKKLIKNKSNSKMKFKKNNINCLIDPKKLLDLADDEIIYSSPLKKMINDNKKINRFTDRFCVLTKANFSYYTSQECFITLKRPLCILPINYITKVIDILIDKDSYCFCIYFILNEDTYHLVKQMNTFINNENDENSNINEGILCFKTDNKEISYKWIKVIEFFILNKDKENNNFKQKEENNINNEVVCE